MSFGLRVNVSVLSEKLSSLNCSQQSIESVSHWCIFYRRNASIIVQYWEEEFRRAATDQKLAFLYLANDILQNSRKKGREFTEEFTKAVPDALKLLAAEGNEKVRKSLMRLIAVWEERRVFSANVLKTFKDCLKVGAKVDVGMAAKPNSATDLGLKKTSELRQLAGLFGELHKSTSRTEAAGELSLATLRKGFLETGSLSELSESERVIDGYGTALSAEVEKRREIIAFMKSMITQQDDDLQRTHEQIMLFNLQKEKISNRIQELESAPSPPAPELDPDMPMEEQEHTNPNHSKEHIANGEKSNSVDPPPGAAVVPQMRPEEVAALMAPLGQPGGEERREGTEEADALAKKLAASDQPVTVLAKALLELPEDQRVQFGLSITDLLNQPYEDEFYDPENP